MPWASIISKTVGFISFIQFKRFHPHWALGILYLDSVLKIPNMCFLDMKPASKSFTLRLSSGNIYFFSFSWPKEEIYIFRFITFYNVDKNVYTFSYLKDMDTIFLNELLLMFLYLLIFLALIKLLMKESLIYKSIFYNVINCQIR